MTKTGGIVLERDVMVRATACCWRPTSIDRMARDHFRGSSSARPPKQQLADRRSARTDAARSRSRADVATHVGHTAPVGGRNPIEINAFVATSRQR
jgi:hypothetical protein